MNKKCLWINRAVLKNWPVSTQIRPRRLLSYQIVVSIKIMTKFHIFQLLSVPLTRKFPNFCCFSLMLLNFNSGCAGIKKLQMECINTLLRSARSLNDFVFLSSKLLKLYGNAYIFPIFLQIAGGTNHIH